MFLVLLMLTALCGVAMTAGFAWLLAVGGHTTRRSGPQAGAEVTADMAEAQGQDSGFGATLAEHSFFKGTGIRAEREASLSYADMKAAMRRGDWRQGAPALLAMAGASGAFAFGSLALLASWRDLMGAVVVIAVAYCLARIWIGFARA